MEDIQVEHGNFARIHNTILERLASLKMSGREANCLFYLFRKTYGYGKKEDTISYSQWMDGVGFTQRHHAMKTLNSLAEKSIIYIVDNGEKRPKTYGFNKRFEQWNGIQSVTPQGNNLLPHRVTPNKVTDGQSVTPQGNKSVTPQGTYKRKKDSLAAKLPILDVEDGPPRTLILIQDKFITLDRPKNGDTPAEMCRRMEGKYSDTQIKQALETTFKRHMDKIESGQSRGIIAPISYMASILEDEPAKPAPAVEQFADVIIPEVTAWQI